MEDILYINSATDVRVKEMVETIPSKDKELPNLIILTILSAGAGLVTPIFSNSGMGTTIFTSVNEIGTKFILDEKEVTSDDFLVVTKSQYGINYNFFGLLFEDSNEHTLKISLINSTIPNLQRINAGPGYSADSITSIVIGNSITDIDNSAFYGCTGLTGELTIPNSVTTIGEWAFAGCSRLTSVTIGNSVATISESAFENCGSLTSITSLATTAPAIQSKTFRYIKTNGTLHVPAGSDYSSWMSTADYYLGSYNWTKVEDA